jgi:SAM-dependent methyltransferase
MQAQIFGKGQSMRTQTLSRQAESSARAGVADAPVFIKPPEDAGPEAWAAAFERTYAAAAGDLGSMPWALGHSSPALVSWLDQCAPGLVRPGGAAIVVGCGPGDDVAEIAGRGYDVTGFDVSPSAIECARMRFGHLADCFLVADMLSPPRSLVRRADLVVESGNLGWLPPRLWQPAIEGLTTLARPRGMVLILSSENQPYPFTADQITSLLDAQGLTPVHIQDRSGCLCGAFRRGG